MDKTRTEDIPQVTSVENEILTQSFLETEVKNAIFQMNHNFIPSSDDFPTKFYQIFLSTIKEDLMTLVKDFHRDALPLRRLNFESIKLLLKSSDAKPIQQYKPICLLNVSFNFFFY